MTNFHRFCLQCLFTVHGHFKDVVDLPPKCFVALAHVVERRSLAGELSVFDLQLMDDHYCG